MAGALDQASGAVEKLVRHPFEGNAPVGATVEISKYPLPLTHRKDAPPLHHETLTAGVGEVIQLAQCNRPFVGWLIRHLYLQAHFPGAADAGAQRGQGASGFSRLVMLIQPTKRCRFSACR